MPNESFLPLQPARGQKPVFGHTYVVYKKIDIQKQKI